MAHEKMSYETLVERLNDRSLSLSYSSAKEFGNSPNDFIRYFTEDKKRTPDMTFGKAVHHLVLTPDELEKEFAVFEKPVPDKDMRNKENKEAMEAFRAGLDGKEELTQDMLVGAKDVAKAIKEDPLCASLLSQVESNEMFFESEIKGWKITGFRDGVGPNLLLDLKKTPNAHPLASERLISARHWDAQFWLYGGGGEVKSYIIVYDKDCGVCVLGVSDEWIENGQRKMEQWLTSLDMWILQGCPKQSHTFWYPEPYYPTLRSWNVVED